MGLGASLSPEVSNTVISSSAMNNNLNALNNAANPSFTTLAVGNVSSQLTVDSNGNIAASGGKIGFQAAGDIIDASSATATYLKSRGSGGSWIFQTPNGTSVLGINPDSNYIYYNSSQAIGHRFQVGGTNYAHIGNDATNTLVCLHGNLFGSGTADIAEYNWCEDGSGPAEVVCFAEDALHAGKVQRCTHEDCPGAWVISTRPAATYGGETVEVAVERQRFVPHLDEAGQHFLLHPETGEVQGQWETYQDKDWKYDDRAEWVKLAQVGRVPVKYSGALDDYAINRKVVSNGDGTVRPWRTGDEHTLGIVCSKLSDVGRRPLASGCLLIALRS